MCGGGGYSDYACASGTYENKTHQVEKSYPFLSDRLKTALSEDHLIKIPLLTCFFPISITDLLQDFVTKPMK